MRLVPEVSDKRLICLWWTSAFGRLSNGFYFLLLFC